MNLVKICKSCGHENDPSEYFCVGCNANLENVRPIPRASVEPAEVASPSSGSPAGHSGTGPPPQPSGSDAPQVPSEAQPALILELGHVRISVKDGDIVGRSGVGREYFQEPPYDAVSRLHARFFRRDGQWFVEDNRSTNGTFVNGARITGPTPLHSGDEIGLGTEVVLRVKLGPSA